MKPRKETITKEKLEEYIKLYGVIEVVLLKEEEPIFILKPNLSFNCVVLGQPDKIILHKGHFILPGGLKRIDVGSKNIIGLTPTEVNYVEKFEKSRPPKEFLIRTILDNEILASDKTYISPIKDFFRRYGILEEVRGKHKGKGEWRDKRYEFVVGEYKKAKRAGKHSPLPITRIHQNWISYVDEKYGLNEEDISENGQKTQKEKAKKHYFSEETLRRDIKKYLQKTH